MVGRRAMGGQRGRSGSAPRAAGLSGVDLQSPWAVCRVVPGRRARSVLVAGDRFFHIKRRAAVGGCPWSNRELEIQSRPNLGSAAAATGPSSSSIGKHKNQEILKSCRVENFLNFRFTWMGRSKGRDRGVGTLGAGSGGVLGAVPTRPSAPAGRASPAERGRGGVSFFDRGMGERAKIGHAVTARRFG